MYSEEIVERRVRAAKRAGIRVTRRPRDEAIALAQKLDRLRRDARGEVLPGGRMRREPTPGEREFITSEQVLAKADFTYFAERYGAMLLDPGVCDASGIGPPLLLPSQRRIVELIGRRERECHAERAKYGRTKGIHVYIHKVRQVAATATARLLTWHRMIFYPGTRALVATLDDKRIQDIYTNRDTVVVGALPFYLDPGVVLHPVNEAYVLGNSSSCAYQTENQQQGRGGLGVGGQFDISHFTEVSTWQNPGYIGFSFWPAMPQALSTLHVEESTANGKDPYWFPATENARHKRRGYESDVYVFIPWYFNPRKWTGIAPDDWIPDAQTAAHAELVERTSPEWHDGRTVRLSRHQLYWWETERAKFTAKGELPVFYTNWPATPEQSFQHFAHGALPVEVLEGMEAGVWVPRAFDVEVARG